MAMVNMSKTRRKSKIEFLVTGGGLPIEIHMPLVTLVSIVIITMLAIVILLLLPTSIKVIVIKFVILPSIRIEIPPLFFKPLSEIIGAALPLIVSNLFECIYNLLVLLLRIWRFILIRVVLSGKLPKSLVHVFKRRVSPQP